MRKLLTVVISIVASCPAFSQGFSFGIKGGMNVSVETAQSRSLVGNSTSSDPRAGLNVGLYFVKMFSRKLGVQSELQYSVQGGKFKDDNGVAYTDKLGYVNVPVLFRWQIVPLFHLNAGPQVGFLQSATENNINVQSQLNSTDIALVLGGGLDFKGGLNLGFRISSGVNNNRKISPDDLILTNDVFQLTVGYKIAGN